MNAAPSECVYEGAEGDGVGCGEGGESGARIYDGGGDGGCNKHDIKG